tara:strand:- start:7848 stop:8549 length:702 start_codon:yes stop_codon:yes gene_type:complete
MLGEREEIRRIKNSFKAGRSREQIANSLMAKGYKYDYVSSLIRKARFGRNFLLGSLVSLVVVILLGWAIYGNFFAVKDIQLTLINPLEGVKILNSDGVVLESPENYTEEIDIVDIEITTDFIDYLLGVIESPNYLHSVPFTDNVPIINLRTEDKEFYSIVDEGIETSEGSSGEADIEFYVPSEVVILTTVADDPKETFLESVDSGEVQISTLAGEAELFSKGYLNFYNSLTSE